MLDKEEALVYCMILAASSDAEIHPYEKDRIYNIVGGYPIFKNMELWTVFRKRCEKT